MTDPNQYEVLTRAEVEGIAERAAAKAVRQTFRLFGVDTTDQLSVNELHDTLNHARLLRRASDGAKAKIFMVVVGALTLGACYAAWDWFRAKFGG